MARVLAAVLVIVVTSFLCYAPAQGACPGGWVHFNESCYQFVQKERKWNDAEVDCIRQGSRLVKIETDEENEFLRNYLSSNSRYFYGYDMWLGCKKDSLGAWNWADGTALTSDDYNDWQTGKPDTSLRVFCLEYESEFNNHWNDDYCDELNYHICERPFHPLTPPPLDPVG